MKAEWLTNDGQILHLVGVIPEVDSVKVQYEAILRVQMDREECLELGAKFVQEAHKTERFKSKVEAAIKELLNATI